MKVCYPANDISSYSLTLVRVKPLSDLSRTAGLGNAIPSRMASEELEFLEVLACAGLHFLCLQLCLSPQPCPCLCSAWSLCWRDGCAPRCLLL